MASAFDARYGACKYLFRGVFDFLIQSLYYCLFVVLWAVLSLHVLCAAL
jgi:hypothetical protein